MTTRSRSVVVSAVSVLALGVIGVALAWACSPNATIGLSSAAGGPGDTVTVTGSNYGEGRQPGSPVEIRWNTVGGPELRIVSDAEIASGTFRVDVQIPSAQPDTHYIVAVATDSSGRMVARSAPFTIGARGAQAPSTSRGETSRETSGAGAARPTSPSPARREAAGVTVGGGEAAGGRRGARIDGRESSRLVAPGAGAPRGAPATDQVTAPVAEPVTSAPPAVSSGTATTRPRGARARDESRAVAPRTAPAPSGRSASGDLWSGFADGGEPWAAPAPAVAASGSSGGHLMLAAILLGAGATLLTGGLVTAGRRRRVSVPREPQA